jgi:hypothetical protein
MNDKREVTGFYREHDGRVILHGQVKFNQSLKEHITSVFRNEKYAKEESSKGIVFSGRKRT